MVEAVFTEDGNVTDAQLPTRSNAITRSTDDISSIVGSNGEIAMYAVNFGGDNGFVLINADKEQSPLVGFSDQGYFDPALISDPESSLSGFISEKVEEISYTIQQASDLENPNYEFWASMKDEEGVELKFTLLNIEEALQMDTVRPQGRATRARTAIRGWISVPLTWSYHITWGQTEPYNTYTPNNYPVGCPAVTLGILTMSNEWGPAQWRPRFYNYIIEWYNDDEIHNEAAEYLVDIANHIDNYSWSASGSGANKYDYLKTLQTYLDHPSAKLVTYNIEQLYEDFRDGCRNPVILRGNNIYSGGGHVWICDGYYESKLLVEKIVSGKVVDFWYEYGDYLWMNWGWKGSCNGWYDADNWNPNSSQIYNYNREMIIKIHPSNININ